MAIELIYFDGPGRGRLPRLIMQAGGLEFVDTRLEFGAFGEQKKDPDSIPNKRFGSLPLLKHGDLLLAQSASISRYCAELALKPHLLSAQQRALDDMLLMTHADVQASMYDCLFGDDDSKAKGLDALPAKVVKFIGGIERAIPSAAGEYLHGGASPSTGDLAIHDMVTSPFPGLVALKQDLAMYPKVLGISEKCGQWLSVE